MFDSIKYNRFNFREHEGFCIPKGPKFETARQYTFKLRSNELCFRAPTQVHLFRPGSEQFTSSRRHNDLSPLWLDSFHTYNDTWASLRLFSRQYAFYGPWFTGEKGNVSFSVSAIAPESTPTGLNLLHPRAFESAIAGFITALFGHEERESGVARYTGPIQWNPVKSLHVPAVSFLVQSIKGLHRDPFLCFPVARDRILIFSFSYEQYAGGNISEMDAAISPKPAQNLINSIINSVKFTPSEDLEKELEEIRQTCPDLNVSDSFAPLKWPATVDETGLNIVELNAERRKALEN